ncbi:hypothetical protein VZG28_05190 [Synechococcus elongatus IITB4]|uniref:hypothetical protein n=1 Tax=Synechococcus elongatus TaxID=32046 RepID=UPI0030D0E043
MIFDLEPAILTDDGLELQPERSIVFGSPFLWYHLIPFLGLNYIASKHEAIAELFYRIESARRSELNGRSSEIEDAGEAEKNLFVILAVKRHEREANLEDRRLRITRRLGVSVTESRKEGSCISRLRFSSSPVVPRQAGVPSVAERSAAFVIDEPRPLQLVLDPPTESSPYSERHLSVGA